MQEAKFQARSLLATAFIVATAALGAVAAIFFLGGDDARSELRGAKLEAAVDDGALSLHVHASTVRAKLLAERAVVDLSSTAGAELGPRATVQALPVEVAATRTTRVRIIVTVHDAEQDLEVVPELYAVGLGGRLDLVASGKARRSLHDLMQARLASKPCKDGVAGQETTRVFSEDFEVSLPGRYRVAWHSWQRVGASATWRTARGQGEERVLTEARDHEILVELGREAFALDPQLDLQRFPATSYSAKDG